MLSYNDKKWIPDTDLFLERINLTENNVDNFIKSLEILIGDIKSFSKDKFKTLTDIWNSNIKSEPYIKDTLDLLCKYINLFGFDVDWLERNFKPENLNKFFLIINLESVIANFKEFDNKYILNDEEYKEWIVWIQEIIVNLEKFKNENFTTEWVKSDINNLVFKGLNWEK